MHVWVIGAGGMLGSAFTRLLKQADARSFVATAVPWSDQHEARSVLVADVQRFVDETVNEDWAIIWAAGSSVVASSAGDTASELSLLTALVDAIADTHPPSPGAFFLSSSAGGVYAGSADPPFDYATPARPISPYGELKLSQEHQTAAVLDGRVPVVIGRFSNLYGPQHNEAKGQGLIPLLCLATVRRTPLNLYVSMDTVRDYVYVDDAAAMAWDAVCMAVSDADKRTRIEVIASGQPTTVAQVVATVQNVAHRRVPLALGTHASSQHQVVDLRLVPSVDLLSRQAAMTTLPSGIKLLFDSMVGRVN